MLSFIRSLIIMNTKRSTCLSLGNKYQMPTTLVNGASVTTPDGFAVKVRANRLARECRRNLKLQALKNV